MRPDDTAPDGAVLIPLHARDGSVRAYAVVDAADAEWANRWRWSLIANRYAGRAVMVDGHSRPVYLHRELLGLTHGDGREVDHIDRDYLNDRRGNLRAIPKRGNRQNRSSLCGSSSVHRGVSFHKSTGKWQSRIKVDGKETYLGLFDTELEASEAARRARLQAMPYAVD